MGSYFLWYKSTDDIYTGTLKIYVIVGFGYVLFKEYVEKHIIRLMRTSTDDTYRYNLINLHGTLSFLLHFVYGMLATLVMMIFVVNVFTYENLWDLGTNGAEPFGVAAVYLAIDVICIAIKNGIIALYKHIQYKKNLKLQQSLLDEDDVKLLGADESPVNEVDNFTNDTATEAEEIKDDLNKED
ncbi:MAG: hypothetical protein K6G48_05525 [Acholeplasmatales bacterium]|nr:hypothetical protein [Acholeplasmatales bacterium]